MLISLHISVVLLPGFVNVQFNEALHNRHQQPMGAIIRMTHCPLWRKTYIGHSYKERKGALPTCEGLFIPRNHLPVIKKNRKGGRYHAISVQAKSSFSSIALNNSRQLRVGILFGMTNNLWRGWLCFLPTTANGERMESWFIPHPLKAPLFQPNQLAGKAAAIHTTCRLALQGLLGLHQGKLRCIWGNCYNLVVSATGCTPVHLVD